MDYWEFTKEKEVTDLKVWTTKQVPQFLQVPVVGVAAVLQLAECVGGVTGYLNSVALGRPQRRRRFAGDAVE